MGHGRIEWARKKQTDSEGSSSPGGNEINILEHWSYIEADFQREYRIDLVKEARTMTARKFFSLLNGISGDSILRQMLRDENQVITDPEAATRAVDRVWG